MDSLEKIALRLNQAADGILDKMKAEYQKTLQEIEQLNIQLQGKEMLVDRSENASFTVAMESRDRKQSTARMLLNRISAMEGEHREYTPMGFVQIGSTVCVEVTQVANKARSDIFNPLIDRYFDASDSEEVRNSHRREFYFKIVPEAYADAEEGLTSVAGPFGRAALGHAEGEVITAVAPWGSIHYLLKGVL